MEHGDPRTWQQKGTALIGWAVAIVAAIALGLYTFFSSMTLRLYRNPGDAPSAAGVALPKWTSAIEEARRLAHATLISQNLPGLSVAVGADGEIVWTEAYGWSDLESHTPASPTTRFRVGHASISLASAAVGVLLEEKRLDLDRDIRTYVPAFPEKQWTTSLRQLMGHTGGVRHYRGEGDYMPTIHCERAAEALPLFADDPLRYQPDTTYSYSTFGWILVSAAVEAAAGTPFYDVMRARVFEPLGMRDTTSDSVKEGTSNLARFYYPRLSGDPAFGPEPATNVDYSCFSGAGGFVSTPSDLVRFALAIDNGKLLKPATIGIIRTRQELLSGDETDAGLGWNIEEIGLAGDSALLVSSASRTLLGSSVSFLVFPERGLVVVAMSNISYAQLRGPALQIAGIFAQQLEKKPH